MVTGSGVENDHRPRLPELSIAINAKSPAFSPRLIQMATEEEVATLYEFGEKVMESTSSGTDVVSAVRISDGLRCVVKVRQKSLAFKSPAVEHDWRQSTEVQLGMPKIARLCEFYEVFETDCAYYVVMEKCDGKDLFETIVGYQTLPVNDAKEITNQLLDAIASMHGHGRIHKDVKIENVMVHLDNNRGPFGKIGSNGKGGASPARAKLIDFDTVENWEPASPTAKEVLGTDGYIAPEAYLGEYSPASDVYAVGVVMYKILVGQFPNKEDIFDDQPGDNWVGSPSMKKIYGRLIQEIHDFSRPPFDTDTLAADLCSKLLAFDVRKRPTAAEALHHPWFSAG